jgi:hypothetical protein
VKPIRIIMTIITSACGVAVAQNENAPNAIWFGASGAAGNVVVRGAAGAARFGLMGPVVKGAPYAAEGSAEMTQTLGDGTHIHHTETYTIYRDGEGRVRRESGGEAWISDPVAGVTWLLDSNEQTARKMRLSNVLDYKKLQDEADAHFRTAVASPMLMPGPQLKAEAFAGSFNSNAKPQSLGRQEMEGVPVEGTRTTVVIPEGQIGNDRALQIVHERWESPDLQVTILSKHTDPMMGDRIERLTNVRRGEPDPALFQVPANYRIESPKP